MAHGGRSPSTGLAPFTELADGPCAGADELLLSLSAEFWPIDAAEARAQLDDEARRLFGAAALTPGDRAHRLGAVLEHELRLEPEQGPDPGLLRLDRLLPRRRGHPLASPPWASSCCAAPACPRPSARRPRAGSSG